MKNNVKNPFLATYCPHTSVFALNAITYTNHILKMPYKRFCEENKNKPTTQLWMIGSIYFEAA